MRRKSLFFIGGRVGAGLIVVVGIAGCHASPKVVTAKQAEGTLKSTDESPAEGAFTGLARTPDGHLVAIVKDNKKTGTWDSGTGATTVSVLESSDKEWIYSPTFSPDGSLLATASNTPRNFQSSGHLL